MSSNNPQELSNRIQVSSTKKSLKFYVNLSKRFLTSNDEIELSGLGFAISTVVSAAEILRTKGFATINNIETSSVVTSGRSGGGTKAKIVVTLGKGKDFDRLYQEEQLELEEKKKQQAQQS